MLIQNSNGCYRFLPGIDPYSSGVVADAGYEVIHATLAQAIPWRDGFDLIREHLGREGSGPHSLCGIELRSPSPYTMDGFVEFNYEYCELLKSWGLFIDDLNPIARTNVAPSIDPPIHPVLHGFSFISKTDIKNVTTFVVAGAGELQSRDLDSEGIIRRGDVGSEAMMEKANYVLSVMEKRLMGLGGNWDQVTMVDVYSSHITQELIQQSIFERVGGAVHHGVRWYYSLPPIVDIEFEMDLRCVRQEIWI